VGIISNAPSSAADALACRAAFDAKLGLMFSLAAREGWLEGAASELTVGIREAFENGLEIAIPVADRTLGWAMSIAQT
jgi:hypothetical protein